MAKVAAQIQLDPAVLAQLDAAARRLGRSRDELIEESVRRDLAGRTLTDVFARTPTDQHVLGDDEVSSFVADQIRQARAERAAPAR